MTRLENWPSRLAQVIEAASGRPFSWGDADCYCLAGDAVRAVTGEDPMAPHRGRYRTRQGALARLKRHGFSDLAGFWDGQFPRQPSVLAARRGDLAQLPGGAMGVVDLTGERVVGISEGGAVCLPLSSAEIVWKVG